MYEVSFQIAETMDAIDAAGLRLQEAYSGSETNWFLTFRQAMRGVQQRLYGVQIHYNALHSWYPQRIIINDADYHLANCLFNMDSAMECLVFALNALGNGKHASEFSNITDAVALRNVKPKNIADTAKYPGFSTYFPSLHNHWGMFSQLITAITEAHDVSKHRHAIGGNGQLRNDPPPGFFREIPESHRILLMPYAELIIGPEEKMPVGARSKDWQNEPYSTLEQTMVAFKPFFEDALTRTLTDVEKW